MSLAFNALTNSPNTSYLTNRDVLQLNFSWPDDAVEKKKNAAIKICAVFGTRKRVDCRREF